MTELMLFPLSSLVLPEGKVRLRIFEPRYKRLISQAMRADGTFGICLFEKSNAINASELSSVGTLVKIYDFEQLDDGLLGVSVVGLKKFAIKQVRVEYDGLRYSKVDWLPNWHVTELDADSEQLSHYLNRVYHQFPDIGDLYDQKFFDDASWVSQRWLEILPLTNSVFDGLAKQPDCIGTLDYLKSALASDIIQ
ncbi:LON peptidase substrate-binding domain-containing protein [Vibrio sp. M260118]|uniref:LON peptidase substrate-binding domain-containing protein n=1 Tax=Vibrio sp. M260118 TaxID=3020896 RepID=UPI002F41260E